MAAADSERYRHHMWGLNQAKADLLQEPCRVATRAHLVAIKGCKEMLSNVSYRAGGRGGRGHVCGGMGEREGESSQQGCLWASLCVCWGGGGR